MKLVVSTTNKLPSVTAGPDKSTSNNGFTLVGTASDPDGKITSYKWTKISGPAGGMGNSSSAKLWAYDLRKGIYYFRLTVTDNNGGVRSDDTKLTVR
jgi:hypothetical protein